MPRPTTIAASIALLSALVLSLAPPTAEAGHAGAVRAESFDRLNRGVSAYRRGQYARAVEELTLSSNMALNSFRAYFYLGLALIGDRRYAEALDALDVALDLDPGHIQTLTAPGRRLPQAGRPGGGAGLVLPGAEAAHRVPGFPGRAGPGQRGPGQRRRGDPPLPAGDLQRQGLRAGLHPPG